AGHRRPLPVAGRGAALARAAGERDRAGGVNLRGRCALYWVQTRRPTAKIMASCVFRGKLGRESFLARVIVVSNRVAVPSGDGAARAGGLEVALRSFLKRNRGIWFGWSGKIAARGEVRNRTV